MAAGREHSTEIGGNPILREKNRYKNILPCKRIASALFFCKSFCVLVIHRSVNALS